MNDTNIAIYKKKKITMFFSAQYIILNSRVYKKLIGSKHVKPLGHFVLQYYWFFDYYSSNL